MKPNQSIQMAPLQSQDHLSNPTPATAVEQLIEEWVSANPASSHLPFLHAVIVVIGATLGLMLRPSTWRCTVREVLARQIYFTGVEALPIILLLGLAVGISVITQGGVWLAKIEQTKLLGPLVTVVVVQNLGPLLVNLFVISRSGTAIATELANMRINGELKVLASQGIDPFVYLVVPRVLGMPFAVYCLTIIFVTVALFGGYLFGILFDIRALYQIRFIESVSLSMSSTNLVGFVARTLIPGLLTAVIGCVEGLRIRPVITAVPQASARTLARSMGALFVLSVLISLLELL